MYDDFPDVLAVPLEEGPPGNANPMEDVEVCEDGFGCSRFIGFERRRMFLALALSLGVHAAVLALVMSLALMRSSLPEQPLVEVALVDLAGSAGSPGGTGEGPGSSSAGVSARSALAKSPSSDTADSNPSKLTFHKVALVKEKVEKKRKISPKIRRRHIAKPIVRHRPARRRAVHPAAASVEAPAKPAVNPDNPSPGAGSNSGSRGLPSGAGSGSNAGGSGPGGSGGFGDSGLRQVDTPPVPIRKVKPEFPDEARQMGITGKVVLKFLVKANGKVAKVSVLYASPRGFFEESAMEAIEKWRFDPGLYRGKPVATWVELPVRFRLSH